MLGERSPSGVDTVRFMQLRQVLLIDLNFQHGLLLVAERDAFCTTNGMTNRGDTAGYVVPYMCVRNAATYFLLRVSNRP